MVDEHDKKTIREAVCNELTDIAKALSDNHNRFCGGGMVEATKNLLETEKLLDSLDTGSSRVKM